MWVENKLTVRQTRELATELLSKCSPRLIEDSRTYKDGHDKEAMVLIRLRSSNCDISQQNKRFVQDTGTNMPWGLV